MPKDAKMNDELSTRSMETMTAEEMDDLLRRAQADAVHEILGDPVEGVNLGLKFSSFRNAVLDD